MAETVLREGCHYALLLLMLLLVACIYNGEASSKFVGSDVSYSIVYPVRVDKMGRPVSTRLQRSKSTEDTPSAAEASSNIARSRESLNTNNKWRSRSQTLKETTKDTLSDEQEFLNLINEENFGFRRQETFFKANDHPRLKRRTIIENTSNENKFHKREDNVKFKDRRSRAQYIVDNGEEDEIFIRIEHADEDLFLQLRPNRHLKTRGTVIEWVLPGGVTVLKTAPEDCYLVGRSVGEESSLVAVSSCDGLTGLIQTSRNSYFIEPLSSRSEEGGSRWSDARSGMQSNDLIQQYRDRSRNKGYQHFLEENNFVESDENHAYQHQRNYQEILSLPEPHVIYKVSTILERLNISLYGDQHFQWGAKHQNLSKRQKRYTTGDSSKINREKGRATQRVQSSSDRKNNRKSRQKSSRKERKSPSKKSSKTKRRRRRNRRHGRRNKELRQRCRNLNEAKQNHALLKTTTNTIDFTDEISIKVNEDILNSVNGGETQKVLGQLCLEEEERRANRRQERKNRKQQRESKLRAREEKKKAREKRRREREQRRANRKGRKLDNADQRSSSPPVPWSSFNLTDQHWVGGYSPDLPWGVAQPGHAPSVLEEHLGTSERGHGEPGNSSTPHRWLEVTVAVDSSVIDFHGEHKTEQYIFTLFNIVSAIYQDPSLSANMDLVLLRLICYTDPLQSQVRAGEAKKSLEAVNRWASRLHHASQPELKHDMAVWLTRHPLGGPSGYAPVGGVCHPSRSCTLNRDEGLTSAFIIAHEMGHVLGLSHDGDTSSSNDCVSEGVLGSVMAPLVAATFTSFHWSRCSRAEYYNHVSSWECMTSPPSWVNATTVSSVVSYHYSLDDQCRMEFGEGFGLCRSFGLSDSCSHLWCANFSTPHLCKTKKGPPLEGTVCGEGKWCRYGICTSRGSSYHPVDGSPSHETPSATSNSTSRRVGSSPVRHNPRHGGWSSWGDWGPCSVTCGPGVSFRTRACDNPKPVWGGRRCSGKREEWRVCGGDPCPSPGDIRAAHCSNLATIVKLDDRRSKLTWLPYEPKSKRQKCRVSCFSGATNEIFMGHETLRDGAPCSYDAPQHHICVQGKCIELGCDLVAGSGLQEDECGVCGGSGETCSTHTDIYYDTPKKEYAIVTIIPKGARQISIQEEEATTNFLALADHRYSESTGKNVDNVKGTTKTQNSRHHHPSINDVSATVSEYDADDAVDEVPWPHYPISEETILLNPDSRQGPARSFVSEGAQFHYQQQGERESLTARGPLLYDVAILIYGGSLESAVHVTSSYSIKEPPDPHYWEAGALGPCSTTCGGGEQRPALVCRNEHTGLEAAMTRCSNLPPPLLHELPCNTFSCRVEWEVSDWEHCSATCGVDGEQYRVVSCVSLHEPNVPIDPQYCPHHDKPADTRPCNRGTCHAYWLLDGWTQCAGECGGIGVQTALWLCPQMNQTLITFDCGPQPPVDTRSCTVLCSTDEVEQHATEVETQSTEDQPSDGKVVGRTAAPTTHFSNDATTTESSTTPETSGDCDDDSADAATTHVEINKINDSSVVNGERTRYSVFRSTHRSTTTHNRQYYVNSFTTRTTKTNCKYGKQQRTSSTTMTSNINNNNHSSIYEANLINKEGGVPVRRKGITWSGKRYSYIWSTLQPTTTRGESSYSSGNGIFSGSRNNNNNNNSGGDDASSNNNRSRRCTEDASELCKLTVLRHYCKMPGYRKLCCRTCSASFEVSVRGS